MIQYTQGDLLESPAEALVNTVNEVGVMGKGIALAFREAYPASARVYEEACRRREVRVGSVLVTRNASLLGPKWIIHFPTKKHWRQPSKLEWVREGLRDLARVVQESGIRSLALPPLGCGNGGLEWNSVRHEIEAALAVLTNVDITVFTPTAAYHSAPKRMGLEELTPARALVAELVRCYGVLGLECSNLEVQKLAWFLHRVVACLRLPDPLDLRFSASRYGPYSDRLRHLLAGLDGSYLHCRRRLSDAGPLDHIWFDESRRPAVASYLASPAACSYSEAVAQTADIIDGFESPLGMELLGTVDWVMYRAGAARTVDGVRLAIQRWPGGEGAASRKARLFDDRMLELALTRLVTSRLYATSRGASVSEPAPS